MKGSWVVALQDNRCQGNHTTAVYRKNFGLSLSKYIDTDNKALVQSLFKYVGLRADDDR